MEPKFVEILGRKTMKLDISKVMKGAEDLLEKTTNPRHRKILETYRLHAMLEIVGRFDEIFAEDMSTPVPFYRITSPSGTVELEGVQAAKSFYEGLESQSATIMMLEHETVLVTDWGFASEALFHTYMPAGSAVERGYDIDDISAKYVESQWVNMLWPFDDACRILGERVIFGQGTLRKCPNDEFISFDEAVEKLTPLIEEAKANRATDLMQA